MINIPVKFTVKQEEEATSPDSLNKTCHFKEKFYNLSETA